MELFAEERREEAVVGEGDGAPDNSVEEMERWGRRGRGRGWVDPERDGERVKKWGGGRRRTVTIWIDGSEPSRGFVPLLAGGRDEREEVGGGAVEAEEVGRREGV